MATQLQEVDELRIEVVVDNWSEGLSPGVPGYTLVTDFQRCASTHAGELNFGHLCDAAHGLSLLLTARKGTEEQVILFDVGPHEPVLKANAERLNIPWARVSTVFLSHWHTDHSGGMLHAIREAAKARSAAGLPQVAVDLHPDYIAKRGARNPATKQILFVMNPNPSPAEITDSGGQVHNHGDAHLLPAASFFFGSGFIPRVTPYEVGVPSHCAFDDERGEWRDDPLIEDERYLVVDVRGRGLVVFSGCSHSGVVNVLKDVKKRWPRRKIHLISGGFHLAPGNSPVSETVRDLVEIDPAFLAPGHCTGWRAHAELGRAFPNRTVPLSAGSIIVVKAEEAKQ